MSLQSLPSELLIMITIELQLQDLLNLIEATPRLVFLLDFNDLKLKENSFGGNITHLAAVNGADYFLSLLGANLIRQLATRDGRDLYPLHHAVRKGHVATARILLEARCDPSVSDRKGRHPIHFAIASYHDKGELLVALLLAYGADPSAITRGGTAPLHMCCRFDRTGIITMRLIEAGADVNARRYIPFCASYPPGIYVTEHPRGTTPLFFAVATSNIPVVKALLDAGADVSLQCGDLDATLGEQVVCQAHMGALIPLLELVKERGTNLNAEGTCTGTTPLIAAAYHGNVEAVRWLLKFGNVDISHKEVYTQFDALKIAVMYGHGEVAQELIAAGADPKALDALGDDAYKCAGRRVSHGFKGKDSLKRELIRILDGKGTDEGLWPICNRYAHCCDPLLRFAFYSIEGPSHAKGFLSFE